jgi:RNA polymerase sigma factor (sigma-70 family)
MFFNSKKSDATIIEGIKEGGIQRRKFENLLFEKYHYLIKDGIRKHKLTDDECFSIYSDTIMAILDSIINDKFEGRSELKTFVYQIFSNKCVDQIRKNTTNKASVHNGLSIDDIAYSLPEENKSIIGQMMLEHDIDKLYQKLSLIGEKCKQMILFWGEGYSDEEISKHLEYNSPAVAKTSRLRCLDKLKANY